MQPDPPSPEDTTLAALGLGPPPPPGSRRPPPGSRRPADAAAAREAQDAAALAWLALADLQPAPDSIWEGIQSRIAPVPAAPVLSLPRRFLANPRTAWSAAAALAIGWATHSLLTPGHPGASHSGQPTLTLSQAPPPASPNHTRPPAGVPASPGAQSQSADAGLRAELRQLRQKLADATAAPDVPGLLRPAILELRTPGAASTGAAANPAEATARLQQLLTRALQRDLLLSSNPDNASIILERGWPQANWLAADSGQTIRHLSFPANRWQELGLWKSPDSYYDPITSLTWSPAPDGLGYLGRVTPTPPDATGFQLPDRSASPTPAPAPVSPPPEPPAGAKPAGYLVSEPASGDASLLLTDLPPIPEGSEQVLIASGPGGTLQQYQLATGNASLAGAAGESLTLSSLSLSGQFTHFSVVTRPTGSTGGTVILTGGQP